MFKRQKVLIRAEDVAPVVVKEDIVSEPCTQYTFPDDPQGRQAMRRAYCALTTSRAHAVGQHGTAVVVPTGSVNKGAENLLIKGAGGILGAFGLRSVEVIRPEQ